MTETQALYIDDDKGDRERGVAWDLQDAFRDAFESAELSLRAADFDEGEELLHEEPNAYQLVFVDIMDGDRERGPNILQRLVRDSRGAHSVIIAISEHGDPLAKAKIQGVHAIVHKHRIAEPGYLKRELTAAFKEAKVMPPIARPAKLIWDKRVLPLEATVREIGEENLRWLISKLCRTQPAEVRVTFVRAGLSGALVLHCHCRVERGSDEDFLIKASRDEEAALAELKAWHEIPQAVRGLFPSASDKLADAGGWYALAIDYRDGTTLTDWLTTQKPAGEKIPPVLERLFLKGGLSSQYVDSVEDVEEGTLDVVRQRTLLPGRRARIKMAKDDLLALIERYAPGGPQDVSDQVERFIRDGQLDGRGIETLPESSCTALIHGDLHGRNIVVGEPQPAALIDPADMVLGHPTVDWARLSVDVLLTGLAVREDSHDWQPLAGWREAAADFVAGKALGDGLLPAASATAVNWLRGHTDEIFVPLGERAPAEWELKLALAIELLRATPRVEILSAPVRVFALLAGVDALSATATEAPEKGEG